MAIQRAVVSQFIIVTTLPPSPIGRTDSYHALIPTTGCYKKLRISAYKLHPNDKGNPMTKIFAALFLLLVLFACTEKFDHDPDLAAKPAVEFAEVAFVRQDFDKSYLLLADKARSYVPADKFKESVLSYHPNGYPSKVTAVSAHPVLDEKIITVSLSGEGSSGQFGYTLRVAETTATDYRVTTFTRSF
jgi:hypothetical protein